MPNSVMRVILLCAGYGTRLEKDLQESNVSDFKSLRGRPKGLLPIKEKALLSFWFEEFNGIEDINEVIIVTNDKFLEQFAKSRKWYAADYDQAKIQIVSDGSFSNESRLGAVADIKFGLDHTATGETDDVLVIAGDTLFQKDFKLCEFIAKFQEMKRQSIGRDGGQGLALITECPCPEDEVHKHGIIEVDPNGRVTSFKEKPKISETQSRSQSPCFYLLDAKCQEFIVDFLEETSTLPLEKRDAPGNFLAYLIPKSNVFAYKTSGRFDVGNLHSYQLCIESLTGGSSK